MLFYTEAGNKNRQGVGGWDTNIDALGEELEDLLSDSCSA